MEGKEDKLSFTMDITKLRNILALASLHPIEGDISRERKMACIAKLLSMGVIHKIGESVGTDTDAGASGSKDQLATASETFITVDLSSEHFVFKTEGGDSWVVPCGYLLDDPQALVESEGKEDEYELNLERTRQGDRRFMQKALERGEIVDTLGQDSGGYNFYVLYTPPPSFYVRSEDIMPDGWGGTDDPSKDNVNGIITEWMDENITRMNKAFTIASTANEDEMLNCYRWHVVWGDKAVKMELLRKGIPTRIYAPMAIIQGLRESGVFSSVIASTPSILSRDKSLSMIGGGNSSRAVASESLPSRKAGRSVEHHSTARKILDFEASAAAFHASSVPPLSPPGIGGYISVEVHYYIPQSMMIVANALASRPCMQVSG